MRPIINMSEDRATDIGNMHKKFGKDRTCGADRYTYYNTPQLLPRAK